MSVEPEIGSGTTDDSNTGGLVNFKPGKRVRHADLGEGVVIAAPLEGFVKAAVASRGTDFSPKPVRNRRCQREG
jgi:hypothetical protein